MWRWRLSPLSSVGSDSGSILSKISVFLCLLSIHEYRIGDSAHDDKLWTILKSLLFSTLMIQQATLDVVLFLHPVKGFTVTASSICRRILQTLSSLSFVIEKFGGLASNDGDRSSFPELKKVFYTAVDILATDVPASECIIRDFIVDLKSTSTPGASF